MSGKWEYRLHASHVKRTVPLCSISKAWRKLDDSFASWQGRLAVDESVFSRTRELAILDRANDRSVAFQLLSTFNSYRSIPRLILSTLCIRIFLSTFQFILGASAAWPRVEIVHFNRWTPAETSKTIFSLIWHSLRTFDVCGWILFLRLYLRVAIVAVGNGDGAIDVTDTL